MFEVIGKKVVLQFDGKEIELLIYSGILGLDVIDVKDVLVVGYFIFDFGFMVIVVCEFKIIFIDGNKGVFLYCGYLIDQLVIKVDYLEICYLFFNGEFLIVE